MPGSQVAPGAAPGMDRHAEEPVRPSSTATVLGRAWGRPLWVHAFCLAVLLAVVVPFLRLDGSFTIDEGAYAVQARDLDRGGWAFDYVGEAVDPDGRWLPLYNPTRGPDEWFAYVKQPAYPVALLLATRLAGDVAGLYVLAMLGALGVAVTAWLLAAEVDPRASRGAFWLAAGGPVAVHSYLVWAHAPSAALAGFATLAGLRLGKRFHPLWAGLLLLCVAAGVLLRAEGVLFAGALALGLLLVGLRDRPWIVRAGIPAACAALAGATLLLEAGWRSAIVRTSSSFQRLRGDDASPLTAGGGAAAWRRWAGGRLEGAWSSLLQGSLGDRRGALLVAPALVLLVFAAWVAHRRRGSWRRDVGVAVAAATTLYALRLRRGGIQPMTGMFAAWPAALWGLTLLPRQAVRVAKPLAVVAGTFALGVVATQYSFGGGREWGGRFFFPMLAPVAVLACLGLRHLSDSWGRGRGVVVAVVVVLTLLPTLTGLSTLREARGQENAIVDEVVSGRPDVVVTHVLGLPPFAWKTHPEVGWMSTPPEELQEATTRLREAGVGEVTVMAPGGMLPSDLTSYPVVQDVTGPEARKRGWRTFRLSASR